MTVEKEVCAVCSRRCYTKLRCGHKVHKKCTKNLECCPICNTSIEYNIQCPVCLEKCNTKLECGHCVHIKCLQKSLKCECPICRTVLTQLSDYTKNKIANNALAYQRELEEENEERLVQELQDLEETEFNIMIIPSFEDSLFVENIASNNEIDEEIQHKIISLYSEVVLLKENLRCNSEIDEMTVLECFQNIKHEIEKLVEQCCCKNCIEIYSKILNYNLYISCN